MSATPRDYFAPDWDDKWKVHNWKNYINKELQEIWATFTSDQKKVIARNADEIAGLEEWD